MTQNQINRDRVAVEAENAATNRTNAETKKAGLAESRRHNKWTEGIGVAKTAIDALNPIKGLVGAINDPSWYNLNPQLVTDVASLSYYTPLGSPSRLPARSAYDGLIADALPGIMTLNFVVSVGMGRATESNAANVAAKRIYSFMREANSGATNYEAVDLMLYLLAADSIYIFYATLVKLYGIMNTASASNFYYPKAMVESMSCDYQSLVKDLAGLRYYINSFAQRANAYNVPAVMPFYTRHMWMASNIFKDYDVRRSQLYHYVPAFLHVYNEKKVKVPGFLEAQAFLGQTTGAMKWTLDQLIEIGEKLLTAFVQSTDIGTMSGDVLKAYGKEVMFQLPPLAADFKIEETYSQEVLTQINGATVLGNPLETQRLNISQDNEGIIFQGYTVESGIKYPLFQTNPGMTVKGLTAVPNTKVCVLNLFHDDPTPDDNMVATRLMVPATLVIEDSALCLSPDASGSEVLLTTRVWYYNSDRQLKWDTYYTNMFHTLETMQPMLSRVARYVKFDWAPILYCDYVTSVGEKISVSKGIDTLDTVNYTTVDRVVLERIHSVALQSLLAIPLLGNNPSVPTPVSSRSTAHGPKPSSGKNGKGANGGKPKPSTSEKQGNGKPAGENKKNSKTGSK